MQRVRRPRLRDLVEAVWVTMRDYMNKPQSPESQEKTATKKKPYQRPTYRSERVFETMALSCGKVSATERNCRHNRKAS